MLKLDIDSQNSEKKNSLFSPGNMTNPFIIDSMLFDSCQWTHLMR